MESLRVRATLKLRNDAMITARKAMGLSQIAVGKILNICHTRIADMERFDFRHSRQEDIVNVADFLHLTIAQIAPLSLRGKAIASDARYTGNVSPHLLQKLSQRYNTLQTTNIPLEAAIASDRHDNVNNVLDNQLTYREREIVKLRFGLDGDSKYTYDEIGRMFKVTRERIRQVEMKALRKLAQNTQMRILECEIHPNTLLPKENPKLLTVLPDSP